MKKNQNKNFIYEGKDYYMMEYLFFEHYPFNIERKNKNPIYEGKDYYMMEELSYKQCLTDNESHYEEYSEEITDVLPIIPKDEDIEDGYFYY